jgi:hypothetical protein
VEDFQWVRAEIIGGGGDASICNAGFIDGLTNEQIEHLFRTARDADYAQVAEAARELWASVRRRDREPSRQRPVRAEEDLARLRTRFEAIVANDFFDAAGRTLADEALRAATEAVEPPQAASEAAAAPRLDPSVYQNRTWVTRKGVFVDRIASAWLIRRFIDRDARFKFVPQNKYRPVHGELRFDMFEGEFTHEGDRCTFETLRERFGFADPALRAIAEVVHDIDLKDGKFRRDDAPGIERVLAALAAAHADDDVRLARGAQLFDDLHALFSAEWTSAAPRSPGDGG